MNINNTLTAIGYIPGIGIFPGVINIWAGSGSKESKVEVDLKSDKAERCVATVKGILQVLGLGIVFLPTDLWVTRQRSLNPPDFTDLLNKTREFEPGEDPGVDNLREKTGWNRDSRKASIHDSLES